MRLDHGQAGEKIEITPTMIEVGASVIEDHGAYFAEEALASMV